MKVIKQLTTQIDIKDMGEAFSGDIQGVIMKHLEDRYVGQCHQSCLVIKILEIVRRSFAKISQMSLQGQIYINVDFRVEAIEYGKGEGLTVQVKEIDDTYNYILSERESNTAVSMRRSKALRVVKVGQWLPIRVVSRKYQMRKTMITVTAVLYLLPQDPSYIFEIDPLTKEEKEELQIDLDDIKELEAQIKKIGKPLLKFFNDMLYPFETKKLTDRKGNPSDMKKLSASGLLVRHERTDKMTPTIQVLKKTKEYNEQASKQPAKLVYKAFLNDYKLHLMMMIELCTEFKEKKLRDSHKNVWSIYKSYKKR